MESKLNGIEMRKFETKEELVEWIETMHLQNTNGRETEDEMFRLGIEAAIEELTEFNLFSIPVVVKQKVNIMNKFLKSVIGKCFIYTTLYICIFLTLILFGCFIAGDTNVFEWHVFSRYLVILISIAITFGVIINKEILNNF